MNMSKFYKRKSNNLNNQTISSSFLTKEYKNTICNNSYLGQKGYSIPKKYLSEEDITFLKKELYVKPMTFGIGANTESAFYVYRESSSKMYLPRFYGIQRYGLPARHEISMGDSIDVPFVKELRDYQTNIIDTYVKYVDSPICANSEDKGNGGILEVPCGRGKTVMALKIISLLQKKTLILVHKEFLMNQWIERIQEFVPSARIGKIQAAEFNVENKDIVIGMIQTIYNKEYSKDTFSSFGLTIIDEVHRIGSEQFSKTLFKTITPYMLGISATVERKDQLTKVLYMFIGKKIYEEKRDNDDPVNVRAITYIAKDPEFNETEYDFRGNPKYSTMLSKLSNFNSRNTFVVQVIADLLDEDESKQIMILTHQRSVLTYLYDAIIYNELASVGYYIGGMKPADLQETETKQIVLATYAMAAEALDIKTLSTLIMVTPKTDITQSVGRILRVKGNKPIVVDIVDQHEMYQKQWLQRKRFYKSNNYRISATDTTHYKEMDMKGAEWKVIFEPKDKKNEVKEKPKCLINLSLSEVEHEMDGAAYYN
jgi:superfamily II DNA or RNA helicase